MGRHIYIIFLACLTLAHAAAPTEEELSKFIEGDYEKKASAACTKSSVAAWNYATDINDENAKTITEVALETAQFEKSVYDKWFKDVSLPDVKDASVRRMLKDLKQQGSAALEEADLKTLTETISKMEKIYSTAKICPYGTSGTCDEADKIPLTPDIEDILAKMEDYDELQYVWDEWHKASGKKMRGDYSTYVELSNKVAKLNEFDDAGEYWRDSFETDKFQEKLDTIWEQVTPLYKALHNHTSIKLKDRFKDKLVVGEDGLLPAHVFGNMWAQTWINLDSLLKPYPEASNVDITVELKRQGYTVVKMFETANEFYTSLGLSSNEVSYKPPSMIEKPDNKEVTCHASAWDFCDKKTFLIKMCTVVNQEDFVTVHHEMGHIQYYILYKDQPIAFRDGANPGFHEAVGDTIALSVQSIAHLKEIKLLPADYKDSEEASINTLMSMALEKIAFLPFGLLIDKWRWDVFAGTIKEADWNKHWWELREKYQLIKSPVEHKDPDFFDPGAKYHVAADSQYISYFVSHILQFQFYRSLCIAAKQYDPVTKSPPLHKCDFYQSEEAGKLLTEALSLGKSKPWPEVLKKFTGTDELDACALLEYFNPLAKYFGMPGDAECKYTNPGDTDDGANVAVPSLLFLTIGVILHYMY